MKLYLDNGYVNMSAIIELGLPFNFVVAGRGTGKTYGTLKQWSKISTALSLCDACRHRWTSSKHQSLTHTKAEC